MSRLPLEHIRIVDLTQAWAGAYATQILGDLGATVIKIESRTRPDPWRGGFRGERGLQAYPADGPGERPYNRMYLANSVNRNKFGITLDLSSEDGKGLFLRLVRDADVVAENFTPRVMPNFGLHYERLEEERAGIILLSMPAYGVEGPYSDYPGIGGTMEPMSGNSALLGEPGGTPQTSGVMYPDAVAGLHGAAAVLVALQRRNRTGQGCHVEIAQQESMLEMTAPFYVRGGSAPFGNRDFAMAPHGIYPCADGGWLALAARDDNDWTKLAPLLGLESDSSLRDNSARMARAGELDEAVGRWTRARAAEAAEAELLALGLPAARVLEMGEVVASPHLAARGFFEEFEQPDVGWQRMTGLVPRFSRTPLRMRLPAARHGEHSRQVLHDLLGLDEAELDRLEAGAIIGSGPPPGWND